MTSDVSDVTPWKRGLRFEKSQLVEIETWARPDELVHCGHRMWWGADRKDGISLPYVERPLNSKVIKSFVPELRSHKCFLCFGIPMLSICVLWTFYVHFTYSCMRMLHLSTPPRGIFSKIILGPSHLGQENTPTAALQRSKTPLTSVQWPSWLGR